MPDKGPKTFDQIENKLLTSNNKKSIDFHGYQMSHTYLKAQGHVTVNKPVISMIYIIAHTWPLCSAQILVDGVIPQ